MRPTEESKLRHRAKRDYIESRDKKLFRLRKRMNEIYQLERGKPLIQLEKPIQKGFKKDFILRDDVARRRDSNDLQRILGAINHVVYCKNQDFKVKKWHSNQMEDIPHNLKHIPANQWDKLGWPEHFKKWFVYEERPHVGKYSTFIVKGYWFKYPYMFTTRILPNFITHIKQIDTNLEKEKAEIDQYFTQNNGWQRLQHLQGRSDPWRSSAATKLDIQMEEILRTEMEDYEDNYLDAPKYEG